MKKVLLLLLTVYSLPLYALKQKPERMPDEDDIRPHYFVNQATNAVLSFIVLLSDPNNKVQIVVQLANIIKHLVNIGLKAQEGSQEKDPIKRRERERYKKELLNRIDNYFETEEGKIFLENLYQELYKKHQQERK